MLAPDETLVRVRTHRARHKLERLLGQLPRGYFRYANPGAEWRAVPTSRIAAATSIKGVTLSKWQDDMIAYWTDSPADHDPV